MDNRPIGVFDSGIGGLTAVRELERLLPDESIVYFGDTGRVPYGTRSEKTIVAYAREDMDFMMKFNPKAVLVACGTVSSVALSVLRKEYSVMTLGVVESAAKRAASVTKNNKIGVISTGATHRSGAFAAAVSRYSDAEVFSAACPLFIPLVENGYIERDNEVTRLVAKDYLLPLLEKGVDTLILGCTHFPVIAPLISDIAKGVTLIDSGREAALSLAESIEKCGESVHEHRYYVSDTTADFARVARIFMGHPLDGEVIGTAI